MSGPAPVDSLRALGLQQTEAEVYLTLLTRGASTGYALAQVIERQAPAIYNALDSLALRGAVRREGGKPRIWSAVEPDHFLGQLEEAFVRHCNEASAALDQLPVAPEASADANVLRSPEQPIREARSLIEAAAEVIVADLSPAFVEQLRSELGAAAARGVSVSVKVYEPTAMEGVHVSPASPGTAAAPLPCQVLVCVADARRMVSAFFDRSGTRLLAGLETGNLFLAGLRHSGLVSEILLDELTRAVRAASTPTDLAKLKTLVARQDGEGWRSTAAWRDALAGADPQP